MIKKIIRNCNIYIKNKLNRYVPYKLIKLFNILIRI